jgi:hypothetical protein
VHVQCADGTEGVVHGGNVFYCQPGHTALFEAGTTMIEFNPDDELKVVAEHVAKIIRSNQDRDSE